MNIIVQIDKMYCKFFSSHFPRVQNFTGSLVPCPQNRQLLASNLLCIEHNCQSPACKESRYVHNEILDCLQY